MTFDPHGKHLIAGAWVATDTTFQSVPVSGPAHSFFAGTAALVDKAAQAAEEAFWSYGYSTREDRAVFLDTIAEEIEARGPQITEIGSAETGLPPGRLEGERGRTTGQLRLFAEHIRKGAYLDVRHDPALPDRAPLPRPDLRMIERPIGPVAVFGASNFPLAFSTAGGDTASALAAGCPVVVKGHEAHPGTAEIVTEAIHAAIVKCGLHPGVFSMIHGGMGHEVGAALVQHPLIRAVGFTGSYRGGKALFDLCVTRPEPIPFFGELGSINPMFLLPAAMSARAAEMATGWAGSLTMGAGQFCTNPGSLVMIAGPETETFLETAAAELAKVAPQPMLTEGIANAYRKGTAAIAAQTGVQEVMTSTCDLRNAAPYVFRTTGAEWMANEALSEEVFGPSGIAIVVSDFEEMLAVARSFHGQLTTTLMMDAGDTGAAQRLMPILERKAGRLMANGFPTGVEVCDSMVHGGPFPASTNFGATSVGTLAIRRFLRPVCYQNLPEAILPEDLQGL
ncbi:aldehyde dehydrogenase (NADP(+)) [Pseudooceanicola sp. CBS1P-1]|uniref:Aldehyde dehydrogenase family protein n=1 Tax=Pseudooceanicola albus TaxID=2692189 RepID=A0A6L7GBM3_9RHOB|nr:MULTISPECIES: aldehyde dehydrogenase (NADP(+)) [Pseudooceanicola]MBT9382873.1 aldehyde dehydrogenase (NADP(+)) [Pseudooceanicola endophyticus]MXN20203.1 aldehyde dehydrogenase family protein [Pseudooceanicola albus]